MRKPAFCIFKKQRCRSALFSHMQKNAYFLNLNFKSLAIFCGCAARFVSDLVENHEDRYSHDAAQLCIGGGGVFVGEV